MTVRIGITGPIGCGKSTVAGWLRDLGAVVIDADVVARAVVEPGTPAFEAVRAAFGDQVLAADGRLDRTTLAKIVFSDSDALARLEAIVQPAVRPVILDAIAAAEAAAEHAVVVEAIKLVEGGLAALCDEVWLVVCRADEQRLRLIERGASSADADARIASQGGIRARLEPVATRIIDTTGSPPAARVRVEAAYRDALAGRREPSPGEPSHGESTGASTGAGEPTVQ